jgi:hypothetical protein
VKHGLYFGGRSNQSSAVRRKRIAKICLVMESMHGEPKCVGAPFKSGSDGAHRHWLELWNGYIRPGEKLSPYAQDLSGCKCDPVALFRSVPSIPTGRTMSYDRCLICSCVWMRRSWVGDKLKIIKNGKVSRE